MGGWQGGAGVQGPKAGSEGLEEADKGIQRLLGAGSPGKGPDESITPTLAPREAEQGL